MKQLCIALAGNPNVGKSTIFNLLTGAEQHVGNWPGKTVAKKVGQFRHNGYQIEVVDLPGTYSLSPFSPEEVIARDYILDEQPNVVVNVLDATNLERNLYLTVQILELGVPLILVLNLIDVAHSRALQINDEQLSQSLQAPVIRAIARKGQGIEQLIQTIITVAEKGA